MDNFYAVILAGGQGTRLWPLSRQKNPKQLHAIAGEQPMIRETYERLLPKFSPENIFISTTEDFEEKIKEIIPEIPEGNFIIEPLLMGNAAACGLVSATLSKRDENAAAIFLPSDHLIRDSKEFLKVIDFSHELIEKHPDHILTIGINPTKPDVNLGYIQMNKQIESEDGLSAFSVKAFKEKPDQATAEKYVRSWEYLWNAGIFIWNINHLLELFRQNLPNTYEKLEIIKEAIGTPEYSKILKSEYSKVDNTSIDYGIMEKTDKILVIPSDFGWNDIGSWGALLEVLTEYNNTKVITKGHHIGVDNENCLVMANDKLIATVGLKDIVVIDTPDALLICNSKESHKVKDLLNKFKDEGKHLYL